MSRASNQRPLMLVRREPQKVHDPKCPNCRYVVHIAQQPEKPHGEMAGKAKRSSCGKCNAHNNFGFGSICTVQYIYRIIPLATASMRFRNKALYTDRAKPFMALPISIPRSQRSAPALHDLRPALTAPVMAVAATHWQSLLRYTAPACPPGRAFAASADLPWASAVAEISGAGHSP